MKKQIKFEMPVTNLLTFDYNANVHIHTIVVNHEVSYKKIYYVLMRDVVNFILDVHRKKAIKGINESIITKSDILKDKIFKIDYYAAEVDTSEEVEIIDIYTAMDLVYTFLDFSMTKEKIWFLKVVYNTLLIVSESGKLVLEILSGVKTAGEFPIIHNRPDKMYTTTDWKTDIFEKLKAITIWLSEDFGVQKKLKDSIRYCIVILNEHGYDPNNYRDEYIKMNPNNTSPFALDIIEYYKDMKNEFTTIVDEIIKKNNITL